MSFDPDVDDYTSRAHAEPARPGNSGSRPVNLYTDASGIIRCRETGKNLTELCLEVTGGKDQIRRRD